MHAIDPHYEIAAALLSDVGNHRESNQDFGRYVRPHDPALLARKGVLVIVADGMGGHEAGEVASRMAVETIHRAYYDDSASPSSALRNAFAQANRAIYETAERDRRMQGMGTTCTALVLHDGSALCAYVGDTRVYLVRGDRIYAMTEDHSMVQQMVTRGLLSAAEARHHADKNVLLRAVGTHPQVDVSLWEKPLPVHAGDRFVVCSDGLYGTVDDEAMKEIVLTQSPAPACEQLVGLAKARGGYDNITVAVLSVSAPKKLQNAPETREMRVVP